MIKCRSGGTEHRHSSVAEVRACYSGGGTYPAPTVTVRKPTDRMIWRVGKEKGDVEYAKSLTFDECRNYLDRLINGSDEEGKPVAANAREKALISMLSMVPKGYYAVQPDADTPFTFLRVSFPEKGKFKGTTKVQTQHSDTLKPLLTVWPSGQVWRRDQSSLVSIELLVTGWREAGKKYARELGKCLSCGKTLTDVRSRHYGVGPDCEEKYDYSWLVAEVDEEHGMDFREMFAKGLVS